MNNEYRICTKCIMDTSDPDITFDEGGVCSHCKKYEIMAADEVRLDEEGQKEMQKVLSDVKRYGSGKKYDCIIGVSGGVDSSYLAVKVKELGLRPLAVHLDNGWNSELAVSNIEQLLRRLDIDLYTHVINWEEFKDLQVAFLKASTPDSEIPTDHAILAVLYAVAAREGIKHIITGHNVVTEGYGVPAWSQGHGDWRYVRNVHKRFGEIRGLKTFPSYGIPKFIYYKLFKGIKMVRLMNYIHYIKDDAMKMLVERFDWKPYSGKHYESIYTSFYQGYILPHKFGFDKRRIHLSALIASGQLSREDALREMDEDLYPENKLRSDKEYVIKKLGMTEEEFEGIMSAPKKSYWDYPSYKSTPLINNRVVISLYHWLFRN